MKKIKYSLLQSLKKDGAVIVTPVEVVYTENFLKMAQVEAYNNGYTIEEMADTDMIL